MDRVPEISGRITYRAIRDDLKVEYDRAFELAKPIRKATSGPEFLQMQDKICQTQK